MSTILLIVAAVTLVIAYSFYVGLINKKYRAQEALSSIDVQLNLRADTVPNVLKIARRFMEHEHQVLTEITELRASVTRSYDRTKPGEVQQHLAAASQLDGKLSQLLVTLENYPTLKSDATMIKAQEINAQVEAHIAAARRFYNSAVTDLNTAVEIFPGSVVASMVGVSPMPFFEASATARQPVDADAFLR